MAETSLTTPADAALSPADTTSGTARTPDQIVSYFKNRIASAKRVRKDRAPEWKRNIELRLGNPAAPLISSATADIEDELRSEINPDWSLTKTKTANLYSQTPQVQVTHENETYAAAIAPFAKALNYELGEKRANIGVPMEEVLNDVVNAAGVGAMIIGYAARFEDVQMPVEDPLAAAAGPGAPSPTTVAPAAPLPTETPAEGPEGEVGDTGGSTAVPVAATAPAPPQMATVPRPVSDKFYGTRISPGDLLWPAEFLGSNFDDGDWIGHTGRCSWADAVNEFALTEEQRGDVIVGEDHKQDDLRTQPERDALTGLQSVKYDELFYWRHRIDPNEKNFKAIWRIVFVDGIEKPVKHEAWKGQKLDPATRKYQGASKFPIRVLTLTYITDNPIPPSDSAAGRPQVNDMRLSRSQMFQNRAYSIPMRWADSNRIDATIMATIQRGRFQGVIPTNGDGSRAMGEIARASYPSEDLAFDRQTQADLWATWMMGPNQQGNAQSGDQTAKEAGIIQSNFTTRIGQERARVATFLLGAAEVMAGLMVLYSDFPTLSDNERQAMSAWDMKTVLPETVLKIRPDSTIMLDSEQRLARLSRFLNLTVKSGYVNAEPIIIEMAELSGLDPATVMKHPQPPQPQEPNISIRLTGKDDLANPVVMALLIKSGQAPNPEQLAAAKRLLQEAQTPEINVPEPQAQPAGDGTQPPPAPPATPTAAPDAHPDWHLGSKVAKRSRDAGAEG